MSYDGWVARCPLRVWRRQHGISQNELALKLGVSRTTIAGWEAGSWSPDEDKWPDIARLTGVIAKAFDAWRAEMANA